MVNASIISSHYLPIDRMVIRLFVVIAALYIFIIYLQYNSRSICSDSTILTKKNTFYPGEMIAFNINRKGNAANSKYHWEFGDNYAANGEQVFHSYNKTGTFKVRVFSAACKWDKDIIIQPSLVEKLNEPVREFFPIIDGPATTFVGKTVKYTTTALNAYSWAWFIIQENSITYTQPSVKLSFQTPGEKMLALIINKDSSHMVTKLITVLPRTTGISQTQTVKKQDTPFPVSNIPDKKYKTPTISESEFIYLLSSIANKQNTLNDLRPYLCSPMTKVIINGTETDDITHYCSKIYGRKKLQIDQLNLVKDENGCIKEIMLFYNKKKLLGLF